jgi:hypothetical protein
VPKVGLDLHSSPCKHWAPAETYGIRPSPPPPVRPHPKPRMWTVSTPPFLTDFNNFEQCRTPLLRGAEVLCRCRTLFRSGLPARAYWTGTQRRTAATEGYLIGRCTSVDSPPGFAGRDLIPEKHPVHQGRLTPTMPRARTNCCHCDHLHLLGVNRQCVDSSSLQSSYGKICGLSMVPIMPLQESPGTRRLAEGMRSVVHPASLHGRLLGAAA